MKKKLLLIVGLLLLQNASTWAMNEDELAEPVHRTIRGQGPYAIDFRRAEKITRTLDAGGSISILIDGALTFLRGTRIGSTGRGNLRVTTTGNIHYFDVPIFAQNIYIKANTALPFIEPAQ